MTKTEASGDKAGSQPCQTAFIHVALSLIVQDASRRMSTAFSNVKAIMLGFTFLFLGEVSAEMQGRYLGLNSSSPTYCGFEAGKVDITTIDGHKVYADIDDFFHRTLNLTANQQRF